MTLMHWTARKAVFAAVLAVLAVALAGGAAPGPSQGDWPMFRGGADHRGLAAGTLPDQPRLAWTFETEQPIKSSAVIGGGRVFIGSNDGHVYALDLKTGKKLWAFATEDAVEAAPTLIGERVYVGSNDSHLYGLNAATGQPVWKYKMGDKVVGAVGHFRDKSGRLMLLAGSHDTFMRCIDGETGKLVWEHQAQDMINGAPAIGPDYAVFGGCDGMIHVISLADGKLIRSIVVGSPIVGTVAVADKRVYTGQYENTFVCADIQAGEIVWKYQDENASFPFISSPAVTDQWVIVGGRDKRLHCIDRVSGQAKWMFSARARIDSSPVVAGDRVVVGSDDGRLYVVNLSDGTERWSYEVGEAITGSPAVADGWIVVGADDGRVYGFGPAAKEGAQP